MNEGTPRTKNQSTATAVPPMLTGNLEQLRISPDIRRNAESSDDAAWEVGDGHSSEDGKDNITLPERRAISLNPVTEAVKPAMIAPKAIHMALVGRHSQRHLSPPAKRTARMPGCEVVQGESRVRENFTHGLVCEVKSRRRKAARAFCCLP